MVKENGELKYAIKMQPFSTNLSIQHKFQNQLDFCPPILNLTFHKLPTFSLFLFSVLSPPLKCSFEDDTIGGKNVVSPNVLLSVSLLIGPTQHCDYCQLHKQKCTGAHSPSCCPVLILEL